MVVEGEEPLHQAQEYLSTRLRIFRSDGRVLMNNRAVQCDRSSRLPQIQSKYTTGARPPGNGVIHQMTVISRSNVDRKLIVFLRHCPPTNS